MYVIDEHLFECFIDRVDNSVVSHSYPQKPSLPRNAQFTISVRIGVLLERFQRSVDPSNVWCTELSYIVLCSCP